MKRQLTLFVCGEKQYRMEFWAKGIYKWFSVRAILYYASNTFSHVLDYDMGRMVYVFFFVGAYCFYLGLFYFGRRVFAMSCLG